MRVLVENPSESATGRYPFLVFPPGDSPSRRGGPTLEYRELGRTGLKVSAIGMGCWAIGGDAWGPVDDADSLAAIRRAVDWA